MAQIRRIGVITMIDDMPNDIANRKFVDLKRNKIVRYENLANYYDETNARLKVFTPEETPQIKEATVMLDVDDLSFFHRYEEECAKQKGNDDLTRKFLAEIKDISHSSPRK